MRFIRFYIAGFILIIIYTLFNCNQSNPLEIIPQNRAVTFYDSVIIQNYLYPVLTILTIANDSIINYGVSYWDAAITNAEIDSMWKIIKQNNLIGSADPVLPDSARCWTRGGGSLIIFQEDSLADTITIKAAVKCPGLWSPGLRALAAYKDSLINKYKP